MLQGSTQPNLTVAGVAPLVAEKNSCGLDDSDIAELAHSSDFLASKLTTLFCILDPTSSR